LVFISFTSKIIAYLNLCFVYLSLLYIDGATQSCLFESGSELESNSSNYFSGLGLGLELRELDYITDIQGGPKNWHHWSVASPAWVRRPAASIEHLMQKLQDVTVTLDNNSDYKHVISCC